MSSKSIIKRQLGPPLHRKSPDWSQKAVELFNRSLQTEGETPECLANLGLSLSFISKKYVNDAYKHYKKALKINAKHEETLGYLGELYLLQGNLIKANDVLQQLKKLESEEAEMLQEKLNRMMGQLTKIKKGK